jgi:hypothetical protein
MYRPISDAEKSTGKNRRAKPSINGGTRKPLAVHAIVGMSGNVTPKSPIGGLWRCRRYRLGAFEK